MDRILENLVEGDAGAVVENPGAGADINLISEDMNDVMKVLTGFDDYADAVSEAGDHASSKGIEDSFTTVQEIAKVVDKATLANEKVLELSHRQEELERRFLDLSRRINKLRCLSLGTHVTEELSSLHDYCRNVAPPLPPPNLPSMPFSAPKMPNINLGALRPPLNMPEGVVLPSVPQPPPPLSLPTQPLAPPTGVKEELDETKSVLPQLPSHYDQPHKKVPPPNLESKQRVDEVLGQLSSNLGHMVDMYDSEATESSSGGESCDEMDNFSHRNERSAPIKKRAKWAWLHNRASIASKWTWLTAQISDLEYRIRQQTDFYRQIRAAKGAVTLGEPTISWPAYAKKAVVSSPGTEVPLSCKPPTRDYSRMDSMGRKIIIKELAPMAITPEQLEAAANQNDDTFTACRTRPIKTLRRRRILGTLGLHRTSNRAAKEATVRCDCIRPGFWCAICFGRSNHIQHPDPVFHDKARTAALLDHSYHQVLSFKNDIPLELHMMQMIKNRSWLVSGAQAKAKQEASEEAKKKKKLKRIAKEDLIDAKTRKKIKRRESEGGLGTKMSKKIKSGSRSMHDKHRRKSVTVHHHPDGASIVDIGAVSDDAIDGSPLPSPSVGMQHHMSLAEQIRKKRETAFDIDNIVIPYSIAASTRVEKLKYKEILTPTWRLIEDYNGGGPPPSNTPVTEVEKEKKPKTPQSKKSKGKVNKVEKKSEIESSTLVTAEMAEAAASAATTEAEYSSHNEDISEVAYEVRHSKAEVEEQKRWSKPLKVIGMGSTTNRNRSQKRQNSQADSGCNTPDPMSPSQVDSVEVNTRPSTPDETPTSTPNAASIKNRRRTSSTTIKSRDRNPSEDAQSSRCTTPGTMEQLLLPPPASYHPIVEPFEPRKFPLSEEEYTIMAEEMPSGFDQLSDVPIDPVAGTEAGDQTEVATAIDPSAITSSRRTSSQDSSNFDEEPQDEEEDEDPDWSGDHEDPDDPEWTGREEAAGATPGASHSGAVKNSIKKPPPTQQPTKRE